MYTIHIKFLRPFFGKGGVDIPNIETRHEAVTELESIMINGLSAGDPPIEGGSLEGDYITNAWISPNAFLYTYIAEACPF